MELILFAPPLLFELKRIDKYLKREISKEKPNINDSALSYPLSNGFHNGAKTYFQVLEYKIYFY